MAAHFEWDEDKRQGNLAKHGVDLLEAVQMFAGIRVTFEDDRFDYGERRLISIGLVDSQLYVLVHTERDGAIRLISGGRRDQRKYQAGLARRNPGDEGQG